MTQSTAQSEMDGNRQAEEETKICEYCGEEIESDEFMEKRKLSGRDYAHVSSFEDKVGGSR